MKGMDISEVAKHSNLKPHTLRYYESIGLIKDIKRNSSGKRIYSEDDLRWLQFINRLRSTGMNISKMKEYTRLRYIGNETVTERKNLLIQHLSSIDSEIERLSKIRDYVANKIAYYEAMEEKTNGNRKQI